MPPSPCTPAPLNNPGPGLCWNTMLGGRPVWPEAVLCLTVGAGKPEAVTSNLLAAFPTVNVVLSALVNAGGWLMVRTKSCEAFGRTPFTASNLTLTVPLDVGLPEMVAVPLLFGVNVRP